MGKKRTMKLGYEALFQEPTTEETLELMRSPEITGYRTRTVKSGEYLESVIYPIYRKRTAKQAKGEVTRESQRNLNARNSSLRFMRLSHCNFGPRDLYITLTYEIAPTLQQARRDIENYLRRIDRWRKKHGMPRMKYLYVIEHENEERQVRVHQHIILSDMDRDVAESLWGKGRTQSSRLQPDNKGLEGIAKYLTKSSRRGKRWSGSRNLTQPTDTWADHKFSHRQAERMVADCRIAAKEIFERAYPGYEYTECTARANSIFPGAHIYAQMRRKPGPKINEGEKHERRRDRQ